MLFDAIFTLYYDILLSFSGFFDSMISYLNPSKDLSAFILAFAGVLESVRHTDCSLVCPDRGVCNELREQRSTKEGLLGAILSPGSAQQTAS